MTRGIKLVFSVRNGQSVVDSNVLVTCDRHVYLAYSMVEAGMFGTMSKKHWSFAVAEGETLVAQMPMYKLNRDKNERTRYVPRVPENAIRGSFSSLLLALETLAEQGGVGSSQRFDPVDSAGKSADQKTAASTTPAVEPSSVEPSVDLEMVRALERHLLEAEAEKSAEVSGIPGLEVRALDDGRLLLVTEWEQCEGASDGALVSMPGAVDIHGADRVAPNGADGTAAHEGEQQ